MSNYPQESSGSSPILAAAKTFIVNVEAYYGAKYNEMQRGVIASYLVSIPPKMYDNLYSELFKVKTFGRPVPLIEHYEEAYRNAKANRPEYGEYKPLQLEAENCMPREEIAEGLARMMAQLESKVIRG